MLEVKPTLQHCLTATRSAQNANKAITASEAFTKWQHHPYPPVELPSARAHHFTMS